MRIIFKFLLLLILLFIFASTVGISCGIFSLIMWDKKYIDEANKLIDYLIDSFYE